MKHRGSSVHVRRPTVPDRCGPGASGGRGPGTDARSAAGRVGRRHAVTRGARTGRRDVARHPAPVIPPVPWRCLPCVAATPRVAHAHASPTAERRPHAPAGQTVVSAVVARWARTVTVLSSGPRPIRTGRVACTACSDRGFRRRTEAHRRAGSLRVPARNFPAAVPGRRSVVPSRAGIPSRRWGGGVLSRRGEPVSCRVVGSRRPVARERGDVPQCCAGPSRFGWSDVRRLRRRYGTALPVPCELAGRVLALVVGRSSEPPTPRTTLTATATAATAVAGERSGGTALASCRGRGPAPRPSAGESDESATAESPPARCARSSPAVFHVKRRRSPLLPLAARAPFSSGVTGPT